MDRVDAMIHPQAAGNPFSAPLHRSFLLSCFLSGAVALFVLPLHLALAGAPHVATLLVLAWMLSQWPLALFLSQSGDLDRAIGISSSLFAGFVAAICFFTGGSDSFALFWLMIPPIEAAFASNRRTVAGITALCAALLVAVSLIPLDVGQVGPLTPEAKLVASLGALLYAGMIAYRISRDRKLARNAVSIAETNRRVMCQSISEVLCEIDQDGQIAVLGGPINELLGGPSSAKGEDWLFARLHVGDRPLYLTRLSEIRTSGKPAAFGVRLRVGSNRPGEAGQAEYRQFDLSMRPVPGDETSHGQNTAVLLVIRGNEGSGLSGLSETPANSDSRVAGASWKLVGAAASAVTKNLMDIQEDAAGLETAPEIHVATARAAGERIAQSSRSGLTSLGSILTLAGENEWEALQERGPDRIAFLLEQCGDLLGPLAVQADVTLEIETGSDLDHVISDGKYFSQAMCLVLFDLMETSGSGAIIRVSVEAGLSELQLVLSVTNRNSSLSWNSAESGPVLEHAGKLLKRLGARLSVQSALGHGESVTVHLPAYSTGACNETTEATDNVLPLAKSA